MRAAILIRTDSFQARSHLAVRSVAAKDSGAGASFLQWSPSVGLSPRSVGLYIDVKERWEFPSHRLQRVRADLIGSDCLSRILPRTPLPENEVVERNGRALDFGGIWMSEAATALPAEEEKVEEEVEYSGGGVGKGRKIGGGRGSGGEAGEVGDQSENRRIGDYYQEMLKADPGNPLLLRNYGRFLHEHNRGKKERFGIEKEGGALMLTPTPRAF